MQWVGVPVIMTSNTLHELMQPQSFLKLSYCNYGEKKRCEDKEANRKALKNRMNIATLDIEHDGETEFPYDHIDLAHYLYDLYLTDKLQKAESDLLVFDDHID